MRELKPGLWHWQAPHPEWAADSEWPQAVSSYAYDDGTRLLLFDPLEVPAQLLDLDREALVVLTAPWHERDAEKLRLPVYSPPVDTLEDLLARGVDPNVIPEGWQSPDLAWLVIEARGEAHHFLAGDRLPIGIEAFPGRLHNDLVLWIEQAGAIVAGDGLVDFGRGLEIAPGFVPRGVTRAQLAEGMRPLLQLPVELVLPAHGEPTDRAALERALS